MFLAIEGIDGAGKRTLSEALVGVARTWGLRATWLSFPWYEKTALSRVLSAYLAGDLPEVQPRVLAALFATERFEAADDLATALLNHDVVVVDRYVASNMAYQGAKVPPEDLDELVEWVSALEFGQFALPAPTLTVWLAVDPAVASARAASRAHVGARPTKDRHEADHELLQRCHRVYCELAERQVSSRWLTCEGTTLELEPSQLAGEILTEAGLAPLATRRT
jgi:dTMP kinase